MWPSTITVRLAVCGVVPTLLMFAQDVAVRADNHGKYEQAAQLITSHRHSEYRSEGRRRYGAYRYGYHAYRSSGIPHRYYGYGYLPSAYGYRSARFSQYGAYPYAWGYSYQPWHDRPYSYPYGDSYGSPWYRYPGSYGYRRSIYGPEPGVYGYGGAVRYYRTYGYGCAPDCDN